MNLKIVDDDTHVSISLHMLNSALHSVSLKAAEALKCTLEKRIEQCKIKAAIMKDGFVLDQGLTYDVTDPVQEISSIGVPFCVTLDQDDGITGFDKDQYAFVDELKLDMTKLSLPNVGELETMGDDDDGDPILIINVTLYFKTPEWKDGSIVRCIVGAKDSTYETDTGVGGHRPGTIVEVEVFDQRLYLRSGGDDDIPGKKRKSPLEPRGTCVANLEEDDDESIPLMPLPVPTAVGKRL